MALTPPPVAPPAAPPAPGDAPSRANPTTFRELADAFVVWQVGFRNWLAGMVTWLAGYITWAGTNVTEMDALQTDVSSKSSAATTAAGSAATSAAAVQANRTALDNRLYPGTYPADPVTRPDGSAVQQGDRYFNSSIARQKTYSGTVWATDNLDSASLALPTGSTLVGYAARTVAAKLDDQICIDDKGADATGFADSAAAIEAAWAAVKFVGTVKKGIYGFGKYRLARGVVLSGSDSSGTPSTDPGSNVTINIATVTPDPGIGAAFTISGLRRPVVRLSFVGGGNGSESDVGVEWYNVENIEPHIRGSSFNGLLCKFDGTKGNWLEQGKGSIWALHCLKTFNFSGVSTASHNSGTGRFDSIWDVMPARGSVFQNLDDLTVSHYENTILAALFTATASLSISNCSAVHIGKMNLGKDAPKLLIVNGCTNIHIDELYSFGGNTSGAGTAVGLQAYNNALFTIGRMSPAGCARGLHCDGNNNLEIANFQALNNTNDVVLEKVDGASFSVNLAFERYFSQSAFNESMTAVAGGINGTLSIAGGRIRSGNVSTLAGVAIDTSASAGSLYTRCNGLEIDASWATSVKTVDKAKFAGYGNNFLGATPIIDVGGRKGSLDGRTWLVTVPALAFATSYQNTNPYPIALWIPLRFELTAAAADSATLKLIDYEGITHDLVDTCYAGTVPAAVQFFTLRAIVPAGWSYRIETSNSAHVTFQGVPRSIRI